MKRGRFITIEGIEGVGKSTQMRRLVEQLEASGKTVLQTREPGGTPIAEQIRSVVLGHSDESMPAATELLLMFAARAVLIDNVIRPALEEGNWVVSDRFVDASRAYQGGGRGIPADRIEWLADWVLGDLEPDATILLDAPVDTGMARTDTRGQPDRLDSEQASFYSRVRNTYLDLAERYPDRFHIIDASGSIAEVAAAIELVCRQLIDNSL